MFDPFQTLGLQVLQRDWLSSNQIVFRGPVGPAGDAVPDQAGVVVDTGYSAHADQTVALVETALAGRPLGRILNTHLHSDHCGGNQALQQAWGQQWVFKQWCLQQQVSLQRDRILEQGAGPAQERTRLP